MLCVVMLCVVMLCVVMLCVVMLCVVMLCVAMLSAVMLIVVAPETGLTAKTSGELVPTSLWRVFYVGIVCNQINRFGGNGSARRS